MHKQFEAMNIGKEPPDDNGKAPRPMKTYAAGALAAAAASAPAAYVFMGRGALPLSSGGSLPMFMASNCLCMSLVSIRNFFCG